MADSSDCPSHLILRHCVQKGRPKVPSSNDITSLGWNVCNLFSTF